MNDDIPSIMNHVSIGTNRFDEAVHFYDAVLATIGASRQHEIPNVAVAYGKLFPEFWVQRPLNGESATTANGTHFAFLAPSRDAVDAFYQVAIEAGGTSDGEPGLRPEYGPGYYGAFVFDLDGHKIEANVIPGAE
ncbi:MAG: VOC family protein [Gammaproteobacteria bacterium]|nr:VOC family protein [Gammaproteobacteria bacterium]